MQAALSDVLEVWPDTTEPPGQPLLFELLDLTPVRAGTTLPQLKFDIMSKFTRALQDKPDGPNITDTPLYFDFDYLFPDELEDGSTDRASIFLRIWIDAISINQLDIEERNQQVPRMGDIYGQASYVHVWIGDAFLFQSPVEVNEAFSFVEAFNRRWQARAPECSLDDLPASIESRVFPDEFFRSRAGAISQLARLFRSPWFCRVWVIQEIVLSWSSTRLWAGSQHVPLDRCVLAANYCFEAVSDLSMSSGCSRARSLDTHQNSRKVLRARDWQKSLREKGFPERDWIIPSDETIAEQLLELLYIISEGSKVTNPRDMIYGLLGMLGTKKLPAALRPDYSAAVEAVFHRVASFFLSSLGHKSLNFLLSSKAAIASPGVPSWVPDFRTFDVRCPPRFDTPKGQIRISPDLKSLTISAVFLGEIQAVIHPEVSYTVDTFDMSTKISDVIDVLSKTLEEISSVVLDYLSDISSLPMHLLVVLMKEFWESCMAEDRSTWTIIFDIVEAGSAEPELLNSTLRDQPSFCKALALLEGIAKHGIAIEADDCIAYVSEERGPVREGDRLYRIEGVKQPCIVRRNREEYVFIGACLHSTWAMDEDREKKYYELNRGEQIVLI